MNSEPISGSAGRSPAGRQGRRRPRFPGPVLRDAIRGGAVLVAAAALASSGCRELVQPQLAPTDQAYASGVVRNPNGTLAGVASVQLNGPVAAPYEQRLSWQGSSDPNGRFVSDLPAGADYDTYVRYQSPTRGVDDWEFGPVTYTEAPVDLTPQLQVVIARLVVPPGFPALTGYSTVSFRTRLPDGVSWSANGDLVAVDAVRMFLRKHSRYTISLYWFLKGGYLDFDLGDSTSIAGVDTLDIAVPLLPVWFRTTLLGSPAPATGVRLSVSTGTDIPDQQATVRLDQTLGENPLVGWTLTHWGSATLVGLNSPTFLPKRVLFDTQTGDTLLVELGAYRVSVRVDTASHLAAVGALVKVATPSDAISLYADADGRVDFALNAGTYHVSAEAAPSPAVDTIVDVTGDTAITLTLLPPGS